jgi:hypothetical protein
MNRSIRRMVLDGLNEDEIRKQRARDRLPDAAQGGHPEDPRRRDTTIDEVRAATLGDGD